MLAELFEHGSSTDGGKAEESVMLVHQYLSACNKLFERGFLSNDKVTEENLEILNNIHEGFKYFENWWEALSAGNDFKPSDSGERRFISWQTWDLLRISVFGFTEFTKDFLMKNPGYYIYPLKLNGSAVETLFSQFKFETGSKLSSVNYSVARKRVLMKKDIHGFGKAADGYRETPLYIKEKKLKRK